MQWKPFEIRKPQTRDSKGKFISEGPLIQLTVTNPIAKFQNWVTKMFSNEGVDLKLRIRPLTAIAIAGVIALGGFGLGRFSLPSDSPIVKYIPQLIEAPTPTPNIYRETAYTGILRYSEKTTRYYLDIRDGEAITLVVPSNVNLYKYIGRRIFATGTVNMVTGVLSVIDATDLELLPTQVSPIPTVAVSTP